MFLSERWQSLAENSFLVPILFCGITAQGESYVRPDSIGIGCAGKCWFVAARIISKRIARWADAMIIAFGLPEPCEKPCVIDRVGTGSERMSSSYVRDRRTGAPVEELSAAIRN